MMILAMMTRVSLGHTGRTLNTPKYISVAFALVLVAAITRSILPLIMGHTLLGRSVPCCG